MVKSAAVFVLGGSASRGRNVSSTTSAVLSCSLLKSSGLVKMLRFNVRESCRDLNSGIVFRRFELV